MLAWLSIAKKREKKGKKNDDQALLNRVDSKIFYKNLSGKHHQMFGKVFNQFAQQLVSREKKNGNLYDFS